MQYVRMYRGIEEQMWQASRLVIAKVKLSRVCAFSNSRREKKKKKMIVNSFRSSVELTIWVSDVPGMGNRGVKSGCAI